MSGLTKIKVKSEVNLKSLKGQSLSHHNWRVMVKVEVQCRVIERLNIIMEKTYTLGPRYWNAPVLVNTGTFVV